MNESEYIKLKRCDLQSALAVAYEAGWSGTPEAAESVILTILSDMDATIAPVLDESVIVQKLSDVMGVAWKDQAYGRILPIENRKNNFYPNKTYPTLDTTSNVFSADAINAMYSQWNNSLYDGPDT